MTGTLRTVAVLNPGGKLAFYRQVNNMEQQPIVKKSTWSEAIAVLLAVSAGAGIGYALMLATGSNALGIGVAGPIALLVNNFVRNMLRKGEK